MRSWGLVLFALSRIHCAMRISLCEVCSVSSIARWCQYSLQYCVPCAKRTMQTMMSEDQCSLYCAFHLCTAQSAKWTMQRMLCPFHCVLHSAHAYEHSETCSTVKCTHCAKSTMQGGWCQRTSAVWCAPFIVKCTHCVLHTHLCKVKHAALWSVLHNVQSEPCRGDDVRGSDIRAFLRTFHYPPPTAKNLCCSIIHIISLCLRCAWTSNSLEGH